VHIDPEPSKEQYRIRQVQTSYPGPGTDGLLTASKIATLKLNAPTPESQVRIRLPAGGRRIATTTRPTSSASWSKRRVSLNSSLCRPTTWSRRMPL